MARLLSLNVTECVEFEFLCCRVRSDVHITTLSTISQVDNASMPYLQRNTGQLIAFIRSQQPFYSWRLDRVWMQHLDIVQECSYFVQRTVVTGPCDQHLPFLCEMGRPVSLFKRW